MTRSAKASGGYGSGMDDAKQPGNEPDAHPENQGASRGTGDPQRDAERAGRGKRSEASTEYAANAEPGQVD
jgi:hypothetical protein